MLRDIKKSAVLSAAAVGLAVLGLGSSARANLLIDYYTTGSFSYSATGSPSLGNSAMIGNPTDGYSKISFGAIASGTADLTPEPASPYILEDDESLGTFSTTSTASSDQTFNTLYFTLDVYQTSSTPPGVGAGPGALAATLNGYLTLSPTNPAAGNVSVVFTTSTVTIPGSPAVSYSVDDPSFTINNNIGSTVDATITAAVPLPASAGTAAALLGCLGAFSVIRRRVMA